MKPTVERVAQALRAAGLDAAITEFTESTRTAEEAAAAVGAQVGQIVKSLVFMADGRAILALVSGAHKADTTKLQQAVGAPISRANADQVREATGFSIGGVPPVGHATPLTTICDAALLQYPLVWAAAGTPNAVFPVTPQDLVRISTARVIELADK